jgi:cbb3-type cytochrome oxidase subunit 3
MFRQFLNQVDDKQVYLLLSLGIFFFFFIMVGIMLFMMKKDEVNYMSQLPLNDED